MGQVESGSIICGFSENFKDTTNSKRRPPDLHVTQKDSIQVQQLSVDRNFEFDDKYRKALKKHWQTMMDQKPEIFHRTMLMCIESSPKLNEIIACGEYCYKDLKDWPKLNKISEQQIKFFRRLVLDEDLNPEVVKTEANTLGEKHRMYATYGLKPHFLDLFQQHFISQLQKLRIPDEKEKVELIEGWSILIGYIIERTYYVYSMDRGNSKMVQTAEHE